MNQERGAEEDKYSANLKILASCILAFREQIFKLLYYGRGIKSGYGAL